MAATAPFPVARPVPPPPPVMLSTAELVECTCPDPCERDHDRD